MNTIVNSHTKIINRLLCVLPFVSILFIINSYSSQAWGKEMDSQKQIFEHFAYGLPIFLLVILVSSIFLFNLLKKIIDKHWMISLVSIYLICLFAIDFPKPNNSAWLIFILEYIVISGATLFIYKYLKKDIKIGVYIISILVTFIFLSIGARCFIFREVNLRRADDINFGSMRVFLDDKYEYYSNLYWFMQHQADYENYLNSQKQLENEKKKIKEFEGTRISIYRAEMIKHIKNVLPDVDTNNIEFEYWNEKYDSLILGLENKSTAEEIFLAKIKYKADILYFGFELNNGKLKPSSNYLKFYDIAKALNLQYEENYIVGLHSSVLRGRTVMLYIKDGILNYMYIF